MDKKLDFQHPDKWLKASPSFSANELIECEKCGRKNAPNRYKCLYCGDDLPITEEQKTLLKPRFKKIEHWQKGFNIIALSNNLESFFMPELALQINLEPKSLEQIFEKQKKLPIARAETFEEAEKISQVLRENGIATMILDDEILKSETPPRRLRGLEFTETSLKLNLFNTSEIVEIEKNNLKLIVLGGIFERKIAATEKYNKKDENKVLNSSETSSDEPLIDIYSRDDAIGYRISTNGFDFSSLGAEKKLIAAENIKTLLNRLKIFFPQAEFISDYVKIRHLLSEIWLVEQTKNSLGLKSGNFGSYNFENVTTINNLEQFTKYSRLQWYLLNEKI